MCGIAGFVGLGDHRDLEAMISALQHRGPDADGYYTDEEAGLHLGHARLSILDHVGGGQPMGTTDGRLVVSYNGEIYNHRELRRELEAAGHQFVSDHSDTEVLLHGYREWGEALPNKLNGMWAFAIYNKEARRLFLSRDRLGQKPLIYTRRHDRFLFASEITALTALRNTGFSISQLGLAKLFAYTFIPAPHTILEGVKKLPAGHNLTLNLADMTLTLEQYWDYIPEPQGSLTSETEDAWCGQLRELLKQAVERRLQADVPLGVFLSGGIDSTAITACATAHCSKPPLRSFSITFDEPSFDESSYARLAAERFHTEHHASPFTMDHLRTELPDILKHLDEPFGDSSILPTAMLCRETRKHVTVALSGDGGDELFGGYDPFLALKPAALYDRLIPGPVHEAVRRAAALLPASNRNMSFSFRINKALQGVSWPKQLWNPVWLSALDPKELNEFLQQSFTPEELYSEAIDVWETCPDAGFVDQTIRFYLKLYLADDILVKTDRASMMHSLEARAPFLDLDLVNFARKLPANAKLNGKTTKYLLKRALRDEIPASIIDRPKKGFGVPLAAWFQDWRFHFDQLPMTCRQSFAEQRLSMHRAGRRNEKLFLWSLLSFQGFLQHHPAVLGSA